MKHKTEYNPFSIEQPANVPSPSFQRVEARCFHCGQTTVFPVPPSFIDRELIANNYKRHLGKVMSRFDQIVRDIDVMHAGPNPVREYLDNEWKMLLLEIKKEFDK